MNNAQSPHSPDLSLSYYAATPTYSPPQQSPYRSSFSCIPPPHSPYHYHPNAATRQRKTAPRPCMPRGVKKEESMLDADYVPDASVPSMSDANIDLAGAASTSGADINIKNHFPVARIKRIMQADDDVGKVAQVTPVVVSKALELFMISLVTKAAAEAKSRNSKRVSSIHLKQAITKTECFDFLNEIVSKVADAPEKNEGDSMDVDGKKKKTSTRRKKKAESDEDF